MSAIVLAFLLRAVPLWHHRTYEPEAVTAARYAEVADDIASAVEDEGAVAPLDARQTALLLASIAVYESSLAARVDDCRVGRGGAWSLWQVTVPKFLACSDRRVAVRIALRMVKESFAACRRLPVEDRLGVYVNGRCIPHWPRSRWRVGRALRWR